MSFLVQCERVLDVTPEAAFDKLADFGSWRSWMPASFRPIGASAGRLSAGDAITVRIEGVPFPSRLVISVARRPHEIAWRGGAGGLLWAVHRFLFEAEPGGRTRVRSVETWDGALAGLMRRSIQPKASRLGGQQLDGLANGLAR